MSPPTSAAKATGPSTHYSTSPHSTAPQSAYPAFLQDPPKVGNAFAENSALQHLLQRLLPSNIHTTATQQLHSLGQRCITQLIAYADEQETHQPYIQHYNAWGERIDKIVTTQAWNKQKGVSAEEGLIASGYDRQQYGAACRIVQFSKLLLYSPYSGLYTCPLAMTDGAARLCELMLGRNDGSGKTGIKKQLNSKEQQLITEYYRHLTSTAPSDFYTSGQWMTERAGGSDVGDGTQTVARKQPDGTYKLYGYKWFSSATDADITVTLARIEDDSTQQTTPHSKGLSCFILKVKQRDSESGEEKLNNIRVVKLKNKLGTKQLPTAELELCGSEAVLLSEIGRGIPLIVALVNITRLHNAIGSAAAMRHIIALARDYTHRRKAFGKTLSDNDLHLETLADMEIQYRGALHLTMDAVARMGRIEADNGELKTSAIQADATLLRVLTPLAKMYTAKQAMSVTSEGLECFGGQGYIEDTKIPRIMRDAQVMPIWEGTSNVLAMDLLRPLLQDPKAFKIYRSTVLDRTSAAQKKLAAAHANNNKHVARVNETAAAITDGMNGVTEFLRQALALPNGSAKRALEARSRHLSYSLARIYTASLLLEHAADTKQWIDAVVAERYTLDSSALFSTSSLVSNILTRSNIDHNERYTETRAIALDVDSKTGKPVGCGNVDAAGNQRVRF